MCIIISKKGGIAMDSSKDYQLAQLENNQELLEEISRLEEKMKQNLGHDVALIAYTNSDPVD
jgi:hypothetical protein